MEPSETIKCFLEFLEMTAEESEKAAKVVSDEDRKVQDFLHETEFTSRCEERSKIATKLHDRRKRRRKAKDTLIRYECVVKFSKDPSGKAFIKSLNRLINDQKKKEQYLNGDRHYNRRGGE